MSRSGRKNESSPLEIVIQNFATIAPWWLLLAKSYVAEELRLFGIDKQPSIPGARTWSKKEENTVWSVQ
jgi:hypothetical protein